MKGGANMNLINGGYLKHEICAFSGNSESMWLIVYDGKYNYMLFNCCNGSVIAQFKHNRLPYNRCSYFKGNELKGAVKMVEFYSNYDNAVNNLVKVVVNDGFFARTKIINKK